MLNFILTLVKELKECLYHVKVLVLNCPANHARLDTKTIGMLKMTSR